jgi:hypothetical protein
MRTMVSGVAAFALVAASAAVAFAAPCAMNMGGTTGMMMPKCTSTTGPVVWWVASTKTYYLKGSAMYGKGHGMYACRATAVARGGHPGKAMAGGSMSHGEGGAMSHGTMAPSSGGAMPMSTTAPGGMMRSPAPMSTGGSMGTGSGSATPGAMVTPPASRPLGGQTPPATTNMGNSSGGQGNTGAPGAGGQTPNNPGSTSNNATPVPRPT